MCPCLRFRLPGHAGCLPHSSPLLLVQDEPTSGLDATTSMHVLDVLRHLAGGGRTVIATIHQPSSRLYQQLDKLLLLSQVGGLPVAERRQHGARCAGAALVLPRAAPPLPLGRRPLHQLPPGPALHPRPQSPAPPERSRATRCSTARRRQQPWFDALGYTLPYGVSLADFVLDLASGEVATEERYVRVGGVGWSGGRGEGAGSGGLKQAAQLGASRRLSNDCCSSSPYAYDACASRPPHYQPGRGGEAGRLFLVEQAEAFLAHHPRDGFDGRQRLPGQSMDEEVRGRWVGGWGWCASTGVMRCAACWLLHRVGGRPASSS